jgi:hypothetical protein
VPFAIVLLFTGITRAADQKRLAGRAMERLAQG